MTIRALREHLTPFRRQPLGAAIVNLVLMLALYGGAFYGTLVVRQLVWRLVLGLAAGVFSGSLFMTGHDACHGSYTPSRALNQLLGRLAFLPSYHTYSLWDLSHNRVHHIYTNMKGKDFVWLPLSKADFDGLSGLRQKLYRLYRTPLGMTFYYPIELWSVRLFFPRRKYLDRPRTVYTLDSLLVLGFFCLQVAVIALVGTAGGPRYSGAGDWLRAGVCALVIPALVFNWMIGFVIYFNHTHPSIPWFDKPAEWSFFTGTLYGTARLKFPGWTLFFASNIMDHVAHHVDPRIPLVRLKEAQERIESVMPQQVVVQEWSVQQLVNILRCCKLYDYDAHCWIDYDGKPTTGRLFPLTEHRISPGSAETGSAAPAPGHSS